ncbi:MAG: hypothetical protein ABI910_10865 [Gemmatimonadota bacterium]
MKRVLLVFGWLLIAAPAATAQSIPNIMKPKQAATRAVAATNAQVEANSTLPADTIVLPTHGKPVVESERVTARDSAGGSAAVSNSPAARRSGAAFERETFDYDRSGRRDPFISLMNTSELRPLVSDLRLVGVTFDESGRGSIAVLRDLGTKEQYRVRVGQSLGRMRVSAINPRAVVFTIEEFGYSRQETLALGDSNKERKQ